VTSGDRGIRAGVRRFFRLALHRGDLARGEVNDEIAFHIEARAQQLVAAGMTLEEARVEALRLFGDVERARITLGAVAEQHAFRLALRDSVDAFLDDLRYVARSLARTPAFTITVVLTFALGIGANAAMFGIIDRLLLRGPEYVVSPERVRRLYRTSDQGRGQETDQALGYVTYAILRDQSRLLAGVAAYAPIELTFRTGTQAERLRASYATWDLFPLLGVHPLLGRFFSVDEDRPPTGQRVVVLSHDFWQRGFGGDIAILGTSVRFDGESYTVVGIAPRGFTGADLARVDAWIPMSLVRTMPDWPTTWHAEWLRIVARLKEGTTADAASAEVTQLYRRNYTGNDRRQTEARMTLRPTSYGESGHERPEASVSRWLAGVSMIVLLIACANITNLLLARAMRRKREIAVRLAIGISRTRLVRLLMAESFLLAVAGGVAGLVLAYWGGALIRTLLLPNVAWTTSPVDSRVFALALTLAVATGAVVGLIPAVQASRFDLTASLKTGSRQAGTQRSRLRSSLLFSQSALSVVLIVGAGLFVRSLLNVRSLDLGFQPDRVLSADFAWGSMGKVSSAQAQQEPARRRSVLERAVDRLRTMPGVEQAAIAIGTPFGNAFGVGLRVPGYDSIPALGGGGPWISAVTAGYFETTGMRLLDGRSFANADRAGSERVTIVNEPMARALWPGEHAIGKCLQIFDDALPCAQVVGVVAEVRRFALREQPAMQYYVPFGQEVGMGGSVLLVRPAGNLDAFVPALRRVLNEIDPNIAYVRIGSMQNNIDPLVRPWRLGATLFGIFGALALVIAAIGLYSVIAYMVAQRTQEFGVRLALGATTQRILSLVLSRGMSVSAAGLVAGLVVALYAGRFLEPLLFETSGHDPVVLGGAMLVLLGVSILACLLPARRATRVDPVIALRAE
jgi:predicted permease